MIILIKKYWYLYVTWIVALKAYADFLDFKMPHNNGFWSLTNGFWDAWHLTENLLLISVFLLLGIVKKMNLIQWVVYIIITWLLMYFIHEFILHGRI